MLKIRALEKLEIQIFLVWCVCVCAHGVHWNSGEIFAAWEGIEMLAHRWKHNKYFLRYFLKVINIALQSKHELNGI